MQKKTEKRGNYIVLHKLEVLHIISKDTRSCYPVDFGLRVPPTGVLSEQQGKLVVVQMNNIKIF